MTIYINACLEHLTSQQIQPNGGTKPYYTKVDKSKLMQAQGNITKVLEKALEDQIITETEFHAMGPSDKDAAIFYMNFTVHKTHEVGKTPPPRPIVSCNNSITENIGLYVEHYIKDLATTHETYIKDTSDFLRAIDQINHGPKLPENVVLVAMDVMGLYTNIPKEDGINCLEEALEERTDFEIPTNFIVKLMELILKFNIIDFN